MEKIKVKANTFMRCVPDGEGGEGTEVLFSFGGRMVKVSAGPKEKISFGTGWYSLEELVRSDWSAGPKVLISPEALKDPGLHTDELTKLYDELAEKYHRTLDMME